MKIDEKYTISGMSCAACSARVNKSVSSLSGIKEVNVNLLTNSMVVTYDETILTSSKIIEAVEKAGWPIGFTHEYLWLLALIEMILSLSIILINIKFFVSGTKAILHKSANMDTLVMLGSGVAFIYSFVIMCFLFSYSINGYFSLSH